MFWSRVLSDIDECRSNPCVNGDCNDLINGYECSCLPGWTGTNCEVGQLRTFPYNEIAQQIENDIYTHTLREQL